MALDEVLGNISAPLTNVEVPLAKQVLAPLELTPPASTIFVKFQKKIHCPDVTLQISTIEMNDIIKTVKALEDSSISLKDATKTIKYERKEQRGSTSSASLLRSMLADKSIVRLRYGANRKRIVK